MKSRFRKVWCEGCHFMVFTGECPHGLQVRPPVEQRAKALRYERFVGLVDLHDREAVVEAGRQQRTRTSS